ncbi:MAG: hypothetical protein E3J52_12950 [Promethearchaeota archaeon]|nr:MAG: hypothetical protein E3J52_12950 [Candidatus Lokiarchaeota archaeon]
MKVLVILGALVGLITLILRLAGMENYGFVNPLVTFDFIIIFIIGLVIVVLTFWVGFKPNDPIPFHWLILIIFAILLIVFGAGIWSCVLVLIAGLIGIIEEL